MSERRMLIINCLAALGCVLAACGRESLPGASPTRLGATGTFPETASPTVTAALAATLQPTATKGAGVSSEVKIQSAALADNLIGEAVERTIQVYLPPGYSTAANRYPVVYFLPGFEDTTMGVSLPGEMDALVYAGNIREMIVVVVPGDNQLGGGFYVNSPVTGHWEDFVVREVVGYVDSHYRTVAQSASRGISGHSMGGFGALNIAMHHPDVFGAVFSISPGLFDMAGLPDSQMFASETTISAFIDAQKAVLAKPKEQQLAAVLSMADNFTVAYGMAFAPNPQKPPFYFDYPYNVSNGRLVRDEVIWKEWESGFGGIAEEIGRYKDNLLQLKGIVVDYGTHDEFAWIPRGCVYFDQQLTAGGIPHEMAVHEGDHQSQLGERVLGHMMPFFSTLLVAQ